MLVSAAMPDKRLERTDSLSRNEDDHHVPLGVPPAVTHLASPENNRLVEDLHKGNRRFHYSGIRTMEVSDSDRPVSFSSTSSSASSRDSHCSFGSRMTLVSNSQFGLFQQDREAGAINLELIPARLLSAAEGSRNGDRNQQSSRDNAEKWANPLKKAETKGLVKTCTGPLASEPTSPKLMYVDRVVQEILQTERTYVQDLKSIVQVGKVI
ncbi:pleckstrin homology domain-containing family G member 1-like [Microcaecilia unicolor]|uniref:Pleckstrin homology domain-containing family G member 1-like n=1 Tax=Microcaecilia unicolor TaxID=1415580 RepID=A0A6P7XKW8_9AMPH|nr:pleckstrin homology domain-containing family G member 1-like [Microcaecilia unicolor]